MVCRSRAAGRDAEVTLPRLPRPFYVAYRVAEMLVSLFSRFLNATFFGGSTHQTTSARAHFESGTSRKWARRKRVINWIFFWQADHCLWAARKEIAHAKTTLQRAGVRV